MGLTNQDTNGVRGTPFKRQLFCVKRNAGPGGPAPLQWETYGGAWSAAYSVPLERRGAADMPGLSPIREFKNSARDML